MSHPKFTERPLLVVVRKSSPEAQKLSGAEILSWLAQRSSIAKWQVPDAVEFVDELPHTATGKLKKVDLRKKYAGYQWPAAANTSAAAPITSKL